MGQAPALQAGGDGRPHLQLTLAGRAIELWLVRTPGRPAPEGLCPGGGLRSRAQVARTILAGRLGLPPDEVPLAHDEQGAPLLKLGPAGERLALSISHTGPWLALALAGEASVGVDIELRARRVRAGVIERVLRPDELATIAGLPDGQRTQGFLRHWTLKEAAGKALGTGLGANLERLEIEDGLCAPRLRDRDLADLALRAWDPAPELIGALAARPLGG